VPVFVTVPNWFRVPPTVIVAWFVIVLPFKFTVPPVVVMFPKFVTVVPALSANVPCTRIDPPSRLITVAAPLTLSDGR
jgi:hypothetical protein